MTIISSLLRNSLGLLAFGMVALASAFGLAQEIQAQDLAMSGHSSFRRQVDAAQKECPDLHCAKSPILAQVLSAGEINLMQKPSEVKLTQLCERMAEAEWPDTILEGPYVANFNVKISEIEALFKASTGVLLGYKITYEDKAWYTDTCNYSPKHPETLKSCETGVLSESLFVSIETNEAFHNPYETVEFSATK
jgi:hypothetical protein